MCWSTQVHAERFLCYLRRGEVNMVFCSISNCGNSSKTCNLTNKGITFHMFPKDPDIKEKWISATGKRNWFPTNNSRICSVHFINEQFNSSTKRRTLVKSAVPTVDVWQFITVTDDSQLTATPSTYSRKRKISEIIDSADNQQLAAPISDSVQADTPRKKKLRSEIIRSRVVIADQRLKIKRLQCKARRYSKKILKLKDLIKNLEDKRLITGDQGCCLENMNITMQDLLRKYSQKLKSDKITRTKYSPSLRSFAMTLHFYSPKAYEFVRQKFNTCLPHVRTIKKWYQSINAEPGFTTESLSAIKAKAAASKYGLIGNLVLDEMAIRQRVEWDGRRMHGYVDIGNNNNESMMIAKEALVFLVTAINGSWKIPVGYFLVDGLSGEQKSNLVLQCLELLHNTGITIISLTFDGCPAHIAMAKKLGCSFDVKEMVTHFPHPVTKNPVFIFLDVCHMMKLVRNSFESSKVFIDDENKMVKWSNLVKLNKLQEKEHLHLANKLRRRFSKPKNDGAISDSTYE